jgi:hypothetical protein
MLYPEKKKEREEFSVIVRTKLGTRTGKQADCDKHLPDVDFGDLFDKEDLPDELFKEEATVPEADDWTAKTYDKCYQRRLCCQGM